MEEKNSEKKERKMRDSGIPWIGEVPEGWGVHPLYSYFMERKNKNSMLQEQNLLSLSYGKIIRKDINTNGGLLPANFTTYNIVQPNDVVIRPTDLQNDKRSLRTGLVTEKGIITSAYISLQPITDIYVKYFHYLLHSYDVNKVFYNMGNGVRQGLNYSEFSKLMLLCPEKEEQHRIADFLDSKCSEIDTLIENLRARMESVKEYKKAVITEAVTKGLDKDVKMKDSGIEWIGEIPEKWKLVPFKYLLNERNEKNYPIKSDERLSLSIDKGITLYSEKTTNLDRFKDDVSQYKLAYCGDFVMNSMNMIVGAVGVSKYFGCVSPAYYVFFDDEPDNCYCKYCDYLFHTSTLKRTLFSLGKGIMAIDRGNGNVNTCRLKVSRYDLGALKLPIPPREELQSILSYLDSKCAEIDTLLQNYEDQIATLEEYKKSLIYEYVTGKKEVPAA